MTTRRPRPGQEGVSLLEALCAITLFAMVASALGSLGVTSIRSTTLNRHATQAAMLAQTQMEQMRGLDYPSMVSGSASASMGGQNFVVATNVQIDVPGANMKTITVTVTWAGPEGTRSYATQSIYTDVTL